MHATLRSDGCRTASLSTTSRPPRPFPLPTRPRRRPFRLLLLGHGHGPFVTDVARSAGEADPVPVCDRGRAGTQYGHLGQGVKKKSEVSLSESRARGFEPASCESRVFLVLLFLSSPLFLSLSVRIPLPVQVYERSLRGVVKSRVPRPLGDDSRLKASPVSRSERPVEARSRYFSWEVYIAALGHRLNDRLRVGSKPALHIIL